MITCNVWFAISYCLGNRPSSYTVEKWVPAKTTPNEFPTDSFAKNIISVKMNMLKYQVVNYKDQKHQHVARKWVVAHIVFRILGIKISCRSVYYQLYRTNYIKKHFYIHTIPNQSWIPLVTIVKPSVRWSFVEDLFIFVGWFTCF